MSPEGLSDTRLITTAKQGSTDAFSALVTRYQAVVRAFLSARLGDLDAADDLSQEVFLAAFRNLSKFREESEFPTWLMAIAKRLAASHARKQARRRRLEGAHLEAALLEWRSSRKPQSPLTLSLEEERLGFLRECMESLPPRGRDLVEGFYFRRRPLASIAASNGKSAGSTRMHLSRVRAALSECVRRKLEIREARHET